MIHDTTKNHATIFALSSAPGVAGVAVIRVSGPHARLSLNAFLRDQKMPESRNASVRILYDENHHVVDHALVITFPAPHSFTGEDVVEYHVHGGVAVIQRVLKFLNTHAFHRPAEAGEFTKRAFLNGKLDLTQAEGLNDLIHAETALQADQALEQMSGTLFHLYDGWKNELVKILSLMEADLDFSDQDLPEDILLKIIPNVDDMIAAMTAHLEDGRLGELRRGGIHLAILGAPNAGKSSLINLLAQRDVAIVTETAGTTRDALDVHLNLHGFPVILTDTAGLRAKQETTDSIEHIGMERAVKRAQESDITLLLFDATHYPDLDPHTLNLINEKAILAFNKIDLLSDGARKNLPDDFAQISCKNAAGVDALLKDIAARCATLTHQTQHAKSQPLLTRPRHRDEVTIARDALVRAKSASLPELAAEDMRLSLRALGRLTGRVDVEDILDKIFRDFCIGK